ncbi:ACP phosphodiesterase [Vibrio galatheae]|uniref:ACP phosphodiesterase n=1 Tax=Vibrio galatheae TaxID=579748 RepID=A0A0F4NL15_9VIBR|nr:ACP phosphodiesterase [Vibrio galatheae]KJY83827.1 ACP phosphodiesterase [Vibrio galatheae]
MNYLAHLHIADHCDSSLLGNLLGDFVKGNPDTQFPSSISQGIRLHRYVDSFTDHHPQVIEAKQVFPNGTRRFSGIALDMFWDHCLAKQWREYHLHSLNWFVEQARIKVIEDGDGELPERFLRVSSAMWQGGWLESYQHLDNIEFALQRMSQRSPRMEHLQHCFPYIERNYDQLSETFSSFYPDVLTASKSF